MAEPVKNPLDELSGWLSNWEAGFNKLQKLVGMPFAVVLALLVIGGLIWWKSDDIAKRPPVRWLIARFPRRSIPTAGNTPFEDCELLADLNRFRSDRCPLFAKAATDKYNEVASYVAELRNDRIEIRYTERMSETLEFIFCDTEIVHEILATSYGELSEWSDDSNGWMRNYLRIHNQAIGAGKRITRIFILNSENERTTHEKVFDENNRRGVQVKTVLRARVTRRDMSEAGNCIIFCDAPNKPIYCLQARHTATGEFERAIIYRDQQHMKQLIEAYKRIDANANPHCRDHVAAALAKGPEKPSLLTTAAGPQEKQVELFTLKPTFSGVSIDLKELCAAFGLVARFNEVERI